MTLNISEFSYLWDGTEAEWALLHVNILKTDESPRYLIVDTKNKHAKLVENDALLSSITSKMLANNVRIVSVGNGF